MDMYVDRPVIGTFGWAGSGPAWSDTIRTRVPELYEVLTKMDELSIKVAPAQSHCGMPCRHRTVPRKKTRRIQNTTPVRESKKLCLISMPLKGACNHSF